ncbi:hypothetical protein A2886_01120 [candidate division WWE3 bacterium RIFCSPHIGHO2_01_FULL_42_13]|uniref:DUF4446 domain-containing protein n=1 Tax=candidate division WWE3 bacterium RIFCSPHIGHO2_01_FULL_42_13 TaxID=1802617 RepID=A0A1F4UQR1_UNCKA|nr:MAG: hypothetical protein A2886_01120 [candidate division WWE3 bacterium RIFCSPHIGHO2_01_FULL_42_13]
METTLLLTIGSVILLIWMLVLTFLYVTSVRHYKKLKVSDERSLESAINTIFRGLEELHSMFSLVEGRVEVLERKNVRNIQRVFMKRFNPFEETGGNQSFSMALLDANNDGVVLSSLHARSGTRIYAKPVKSGKQTEHELSMEEQEVISLAAKEI